MQKTNQEKDNTPANVEIVFLSDERKGQALGFNADVISFGRSSDCNVVFQNAPLTVSRVHARIVTNGDYYLFENIGPNGSLVNGKPVQRCELVSGDVIQFSNAGPSVRFIGHRRNQHSSRPSALSLHVGTDVYEFPTGSVVFGSAEDCDCIMPGLAPHHVLVRFEDQVCQAKNLSQQDVILVNGKLQKFEAVLTEDSSLQIGRDGPRFKYIGAGRLIKVEEKQRSQSSDELRTYIIPAPRPSLLDKFKRSKD